MQLQGLKVAVVGGGIGGMAAAAALAQRGAMVRLYEQADALREVGAGLQVSVNGQVVLRALGAGDIARAAATVAQGTVILDGRSGRRITVVPAPAAGPTWYMHRADLLAVLADTAQRAGVDIRLGRAMAPGEVEADLIVAADGGRGNWRSTVDGEVSAVFTGQVAWRSVVPWSGDPLPQMAQLFMGSGAHVVVYPLRQDRAVNLVAVEERGDWTGEGWTRTGDVDELRRRFTGFLGVAAEVIRRAQTAHVWALHLRPVARRWVAGNTALVGDSAHPTLPFMAQGACLALEDAWVLASALAAEPEIGAALATYERLRRPRAQRVVALAGANARRFHLRRPWAYGAQAALKLGGGILARRLEWLYGYDATDALIREPGDLG